MVWNLDVGNRLLLGFDPNSGQALFSQPLSGTPAHFAAPSSGAGHIVVPSGSILEAFSVSGGGGGPTPTPTPSAVPTATPTPPAQATYSSKATASPNPVGLGGTVSIASSVTSSQASTAAIDVEVFDPSNTRVFQQTWDNQAFMAGQPKTFNSAWQVPLTATTGTYTIRIGVFAPGWGSVYNWNNSAGSFSVMASRLPTRAPGIARTMSGVVCISLARPSIVSATWSVMRGMHRLLNSRWA